MAAAALVWAASLVSFAHNHERSSWCSPYLVAKPLGLAAAAVVTSGHCSLVAALFNYFMTVTTTEGRVSVASPHGHEL